MHAEATSQFPGYAAIELLYTGSRTTVFRARRVADDKPVILKVANTGHASLDEALARLRHEVDIIEAIGSPRVIRVYDVATLGGDTVLVVQDFGSESVDRYLARAQLSLADTLGIAISVVAALRDVHAAGVLHKDVTPGNI